MTAAEIGAEFASRCLDFDGYPYLWAAEGPEGFDCSGLPTAVGWDMGLWPRSVRWTTRTIWKQWAPTTDPQPGDVVLYAWAPKGPVASMLLNMSIGHVMVVTGPSYLILDGPVAHRVYPVVGASGGGRRTTTVAKAREQGARVRRYRSHEYRDFVAGFRKLPIPADLLEA